MYSEMEVSKAGLRKTKVKGVNIREVQDNLEVSDNQIEIDDFKYRILNFIIYD